MVAKMKTLSFAVLAVLAIFAMQAMADNPPGPPVLTITVSPSNVTLNENESVQFTANETYSGGAIPATFTWTVSNITVGTITSAGLFTAHAAGTTVTATDTHQSISGNATVTVQSVNIMRQYLPCGETQAQRKTGITNAMNDFFFNHMITKDQLTAVLNEYFFPSC